ncbi:hypothetical protein C0J52_23484 [Blattella germanica]|nr:hypothetical protein C0J52_23484 [Blattella germanica]
MYEILNSEISEKQNQIFILQRDIQLLEEKSEQLQVTSQFKDDIIKEMRKELKLTRFKFGSTRPDFTSNADSEVQYKSSYANSSLLTSQTPQFSSIQSDKQQLNLHDTTQYSVDLQKQPIDASSSENILQKMYIPCNESQNLKFSLQQHIPERLANPNVEIKSSKLNSIKSLNVISSKHNYKCTGVESEGFILNLTNNMNVKKLLRKHSSSPPTRDG